MCPRVVRRESLTVTGITGVYVGDSRNPGTRIPAGACSEGPGAPVAGKHRDLQRVGVWSTTGVASGGMVSGALYPPRTQVRCQGYRMGSCLGTAANGLYDLGALKYDVAPEWPPLPQTPRHTLSLSCWQSCRETVKYTRASLSQGITHSTLCTWLTSRRWEPHSLGKNDKWIPEGRPGPQMQRAGGKGL